MNCKEARPLIHDYLDGDLQEPTAVRLNDHLQTCSDCRLLMRQLEQADALLRSMPEGRPPAGLRDRVMDAVPPSVPKRSRLQWVKRHPAVSAAALFLLVMLGSYVTLWNQDTEMVVKGKDLQHIIIHGDSVIVPAGYTVKGDLFVENGRVEVDGKVDGNVTVVDGKLSLASTAYISGEVTSINRALDWIWYRMNQLFSDFTRISQ
ncbi:zf-HC2 domain-containing protein [Ferviditalea candida]|uniref:Anti-sigma-W factor RsiW n=1 Tax=Ferviditalea candida TaxID=3108399 RepID=A0ABU5ZNF7_9BACL|nr:zf-HC2 domain-containing protein [Paenibacillaceae bacterium T2]